MRKLFLFLPVVALCFLCACTKEETTTNEPDDNTGGSTSSLVDPALAWSSSSVTAVLGSAVTFPTLTNKYNVSVTYSSSNTGVATITSDGTVTVIAAGAATITASSVATDTYSAGSASYTLTVTDGEDTGAGSYKYGSTGDTASDDDISNTTFTRMVTVTYSTGGATVAGLPTTGDIAASVTGNNVTLTNSGSECVVYRLTGTAADGFFKLYSSKKQAILLDGVSITCSTGAAINNQSKKRTFVMVEGKNTLADGASASYAATGEEDMKAVIFSEGQLVFSGTGSLTVTANNKQGKSGIVSDDYVRIMSNPTISVTAGASAGHGVRGKDYVQISDGNFSVSTSAAMKKAVGSDDYVLVEGGTSTITVSGGVAYDSDDQEYKGTAGIKADNYFAMTGGTVTIKNTGGGGKGISAGSYDFNSETHAVDDSYITGGTLTITTSGSEVNDESAKGIKIGWVTKTGSGDRATVTGNAGNFKINGGKVIITSKCEGLEAKGNLTFNGGEVYVYSSGDDAINCQGEMNVNGGYVYAYSSGNDAMDANHDLKLNGGYVFAVTSKGQPEVAIDANTEGGYKLYINNGATVVAYGGLESNFSAAQKVYSMSCTANAWNALYGDNAFIAAFKTPSGASSLAVSAPSLSKGYKGVSVSGGSLCNGIWAISGISGGTAVSLSNYSNGGGGPGGRW
ncbi:MAG: carbohydrate-binding domain-containing protein [Bacteroidales bacterium]|nr:carbohydrate-binding domain-containing protein [Bacteroidales bacterium]